MAASSVARSRAAQRSRRMRRAPCSRAQAPSFLFLMVMRGEAAPEKHRDDHGEDDDILERAGPERRERFEQADQERADRGERIARQTADDRAHEALERAAKAG